jgi:methionyl-tRNA formyltransferase
VAVVSQPDRGRGRGRVPSPSPVARVALRSGVPLLRPERVGSPEVAEALRDLAPDLGVVAAFGQFLPRRIRELPRLGFLINAHASLLPAYRGAAPIARSILAGETRTGVSIMRVEKEMDAGPVALQRATPIGEGENAGELEARLALLAADLVAEALEAISAGELRWTPQDHARASFAPRVAREEARLDWREPAAALVRRVRAMAPSPGAFTTLDGEPLRILSARVLAGPVDREPGCVARGEEPPLRVATGEGWLEPCLVQRPGGRAMPVAAFLNGRPVPDGAQLGASMDA